MNKATSASLKQANTKTVLEFIYRRERTSKPEIAAQLNLSRPTINQIVKTLMEGGWIRQGGYLDSTGGRKADALVFESRSKVAIGVELLKDTFEMVAIDLYGGIIRSEMHILHFSQHNGYIEAVCRAINGFIAALGFEPSRVLGVGIVLQGLISSDGQCVTYGKILNCTGMRIQSFMPYLPYPCGMIHDGEAAATDELWFAPDIRNAIFFHIRSNMSGALIVNARFLQGNELKSGVFEHMTIVPGGRPCYCGKYGCMETYCSLRSLLIDGETAADFFSRLRQGAPRESKRWEEYLGYLSTAIDNLHMMVDYDVILGGILGRYLIPEDIDRLHRLIAGNTAFPTDRKFIRISATANTPIAAGAALPYVIRHLDFS